MILKMAVMAGTVAALHLLGVAERGIRPDARLTPGVAGTATAADICRSGYARRARNVPVAVKHQVLAEYGIVPLAGERFEIDHLVPLELGGTNDRRNLWPQPFAGTWTAADKDRLENALHGDVCANREPLARAQQEVQANWVSAYVRRFGAKGGTGDGG